ncbi:Membrane primary amine oxidase [Paramyrothecium foliicola]|nr:Membrane primary amine oxidase [Paramyrothecium foliicola]
MRFTSAVTALAVTGAYASGSLKCRDTDPNVKGPYIASTAPRENIFAPISVDEANSIGEFLKSQANVTIPADIYFNTYDGLWLLAPNKTDATAYLDGNGPKPPRYARTFGQHNCFDREYMIGPLPVSNKTRATPLTYTNHGNAEIKNSWCDETSSNGRRDQIKKEAHEKRKRNNVQRRASHNPYEEKMEWNGREMPHDEKAPPVAILPDGARHEFDPKQNYVSWMDFTFFVSTGPAGISLHDIRFKGERVVYELGMQEALAHYAGPDKEQTENSYLDVTVGFTIYNLIPGYDCPSYATYTDAFCLFEFPKDYPMSRHRDYPYYHATKNIAFILRSVSTVLNYDYQTTYEFYYDGSIQVLVRATGYIQASTVIDVPDEREYGFRIRPDLSGSMHDHVLNFKADLDIQGQNNTLLKTEFIPHSQVYDWSNGEVINTMKVKRDFIANEDQGKINWAANSAAAYSVVNKDKENEFGEFPGYRIYPSTGSPIHVTVENSTVFGKLIDWAYHHLHVLKRKDSEPVAAHPMTRTWDLQSLVEFGRFFDGESLEQEDIVLYFNLGMHHMPDTYDLPVTVFQGAQSGITLRPQNYERSDNSISTRQQIHITNKEDTPVANTYGVNAPSGTFDLNNTSPPWYPLAEWWS